VGKFTWNRPNVTDASKRYNGVRLAQNLNALNCSLDIVSRNFVLMSQYTSFRTSSCKPCFVTIIDQPFDFIYGYQATIDVSSSNTNFADFHRKFIIKVANSKNFLPKTLLGNQRVDTYRNTQPMELCSKLLSQP